MSVTLFYPKTERDLRIQYPELSSIPEFKNVSSRELLFVWYYANPTYNMPDGLNYKEKIDHCIKQSKWTPSNDIYNKIIQNVWPENVKKAISRMESFDASTRNKARKIIMEIFTNFEKMVKVDDNDFKLVDKDGKDLGIDFAAKNQYVNYAKNIAATMPDLIKNMEEGFGTQEEKEIENNEKAITKWHKSKGA